MEQHQKANRGPGAAAGNRRALVAAAAEVFGDRGIDAPLSAVARRAGVGQGSLYRHFPDRVSLALAAFEDNVAQLEILASRPGTTLADLLSLLTEQTLTSVALVDVVSAASAEDPRISEVRDRVRSALAPAVDRAHEEGSVRGDADVDDLVLAVGLVATLVAKTPSGERRAVAEAAWRLLDRGLRA